MDRSIFLFGIDTKAPGGVNIGILQSRRPLHCEWFFYAYMSLTKYLVSDILQIISDLRGEASVNTDADRIRAISRSEQDLARRMFFRIHLIKDQSIGTGDDATTSFTIGSATYPMRNKGLTEVFVGGTARENRREVVDFAQFKELYDENNDANIAYEYFDQANDVWKVRVNPTPDTGDEVTASWYYIPPTRTTTSDSVITSDPYIIAYLALADIYHGEDELQSEQLARQEAENRLDEAMGIENSPAVNQTYQMQPPTRKGIGSY